MFYNSEAESKLLVCSGSISNFNDADVIATFDKVMPRPTMAAGTITCGFLSISTEGKSSFFTSSTDGFTQLAGITKFSKADLNARLSSVTDVPTRGQLLKHFSAILGHPMAPLEFSQISYDLDDTQQPDKAKNIPQKHAMHLTSGTADFPSDHKPAVDEVFLKFVPATQLANIDAVF